MPRICIDVDEKMFKVLEKRAKSNFLSVREMVEDILRRSMVSYKKNTGKKSFKVDDRLVSAFSRERRGRKKK